MERKYGSSQILWPILVFDCASKESRISRVYGAPGRYWLMV